MELPDGLLLLVSTGKSVVYCAVLTGILGTDTGSCLFLFGNASWAGSL